jgi:hypothetical protein
MKTSLAVLLSSLFVTLACGGGGGGDDTAPGLLQKTADDERTLGCLTPEQTVEHEGDYVLVCGTVAEAIYVQENNRTTYMHFGAPSPNQVFTAVITGGSRSGFNPFPEDQFAAGTNACVEGVIELDENGLPSIDVQSSLSMISIKTLEISGEHCTGN